MRYEDGDQTVQPIGGALAPTRIANSYWLPAATVTWSFLPDMQLRLHASKTIARPQFRELAPQIYQDFESDREFTGNPFLTDSELLNVEARYEYYFARGQRLSRRRLLQEDRQSDRGGRLLRRRRPAPHRLRQRAAGELYGAEVEVQAYLPLAGLGGALLRHPPAAARSAITPTPSREISADDSVIIGPDLQPVAANLLFEDGAPLTGQSDHLANLQIGIEDTDSLSQATFLITYASERVTNRGPIQGLLRQPDIIERPGPAPRFRAPPGGADSSARAPSSSFEARNLTGQDYEEFQQIGGNRIDINSYAVGQSFSLGVTVHF